MTRQNRIMMTAALGGLALAATVSASSAEKGSGTPNPQTIGECHGINSCKGSSACHGAGNGCAGRNSCKGKGWVKTSKGECDRKGGSFRTG